MNREKRYRAIGKALPRVEAAQKALGQTRYAADIQLPGLLWAKVLRSPHPHARIVSVNLSKARELCGVRVALAGQDLPQVLVGKRIKDMPILAREKVRYVGEPVAAVAAESLGIAEEALGLIEVEYEELASITDPLEAMKPHAPRLHDDPARYRNAPALTAEIPNLQSAKVWEHGDLSAAWEKAERVFEHTFHTQITHHGYLEPHACVVSVSPQGQIEIWASNKSPYVLRDELAKDLSLPPERIKVRIMAVGGDFGGKASLIDVPICYFLAQRSGSPVKLVLTYAEELSASSHRHPAVISLRTGVTRGGTLAAMEAKVIFSGGAYAAFKHAPEGIVMGPGQTAGSYRIPAIRIETCCVYTNHVSGTQVRSPGCPQVVFAVESHLDIIARDLGIDPVEFRLRNLVGDGDSSPLGKRWQHVRARETLEKAAAASNWGRAKPNRYTGRGVAIYERGVTSGKSSAAIALDSEGRVTVFTGVPDVGPGIYTVIQQIVAETLGVSVEKVRVKAEDTDTVPYDTGVGGSRATNTAGHAAHQAAVEVGEKLIEVVAKYWDCRPEEIRRMNGAFLGPKEKRLSFQQACRLGLEQNGGSFTHVVVVEPSNQPVVTSFCAQVAEVELDPESGAVRIKRLVTAHDVGTVLNSVTHQGQIEGGVIQGMGFGLMEETPLADGRVAVANMGEFKIPTVKDIPQLKTIILESPTGPVPYQGKAIGEIPNVPTAAAIANAIADAAGVRFFELPISAEKLYWEIRNKRASLLTP